jgi:secreted PhoX family phosphatase
MATDLTLLPMYGHTCGNRSPVTCHLRCDSACAKEVPNSSAAPTFREVATRQLSRRQVLIAGGAVAATAAVPSWLPEEAAAAPTARPRGLAFTAIRPVEAAVDAVTVPPGYEWHTILRWGDPLFWNSPAFDPSRPNADAQELQFGYNNDYLDILVQDRRGREALLVCNHEYVNRGIMFPTFSAAEELEVIKTTIAAHGMSVVELERNGRGRPWRYVRGGRKNRRITAATPFRLTGPAAGGALVKTAADPSGTRVYGTFGNCAGGTTPWGTVLSGEENFNGYFIADPNAVGSKRYGLSRPSSGETTNKWEKVDPRFDATKAGYQNEPHRFGYIVEVDPQDPTSTPRKHTAMGRFKHEGANVRVDQNGTVVAYMGDDERFDYLYKFVASRKFTPGNSARARRRNLTLLENGDLYVAKFSGAQQPDDVDNLGTGVWIPLTRGGRSLVPNMSIEEVLVFTRLAADAVDATPMDRPEDVEPSLKTGKVYVACTNNTSRGGADNASTPQVDESRTDAANPRKANKDGHVIEITERGNRGDATTFAWNLLLVCGDPADPTVRTYFGGYPTPVTPISCPDNVAFDSQGTLWISTDGQPSAIKKADGLFKVGLTGANRGKVEQFLAVPREAETTGPVIHDQDGSVFVAVQHPGEDGNWTDQHSYFPDYVPAGGRPARGDWRGPRPSVIQVTKKR